jgi:hypothetical protein
MRVDIYTMIAQEKFNRPNSTGISWEVLNLKDDGFDGTRVVIADVPNYVKGPKAGKPNYKASTDRQTLLISEDEAEAWVAQHPEICLECGNTGEVFVRWSAEDGTTTRPCSKGCPVVEES